MQIRNSVPGSVERLALEREPAGVAYSSATALMAFSATRADVPIVNGTQPVFHSRCRVPLDRFDVSCAGATSLHGDGRNVFRGRGRGRCW